MSAVLVEDGIDKGAVWHFGQPNHEQRALYEGTAWADLSHRAVITVSGEDRLKWLHDLTTQYLLDFAPHTWTTALILDPQGHVEHQLFLVDDGTTTWIHTEIERAPSLMEYLQKMIFMLRVEVSDRTSEFAVMRAPGKPDGMGGPYEIIARQDLADIISIWSENNMQIGTWALEAERIASGRPRIGADMDYKSIPNELGLLNTSVHMQKGCYRGQETVAKVFNLGQPPRRLTMLHLDGSMVDLPAHGAPVEFDGKEVGFIGSVARHYELGPIALALIKRSVPVDATLVAAGIPASQELINR